MSAIGQKADYVRARLGSAPGKHHCHWPGCEQLVPPAVWGCRKHWYKLPLELRRKVWAAFRPGQEESKTPSQSYVDVAREVQEWIRANDPPAVDPIGPLL